MKRESIQKLSEGQFRRITGVKRDTFNKMVELVQLKKPSGRRGRPFKLSVEEQVLMMLEYLREYRTYAHIAASYGIAESRAFANIRLVENILIKSKEFSLPGKKALLKSDFEFETILIDVTESPIERPKKNSASSTLARKKDTPSKLKS